MSDAAASAPIRIAPIALWRMAQAFLNILHDLFGAPEDIAFHHTYLVREYKQVLSWLRCAEAMLRRLLLIEAAHYPKPNTRPLLRPPPKLEGRQRVRRLVTFEHDKPEDWRVSFRVLDGPRRRGRTRARARGHPDCPTKRFRDAWPLALRYEALMRVFKDPTARARRLARRLHATPHRLAEALRAPPEAVNRIDDFEDMGERAQTAWRPHFSSA